MMVTIEREATFSARRRAALAAGVTAIAALAFAVPAAAQQAAPAPTTQPDPGPEQPSTAPNTTVTAPPTLPQPNQADAGSTGDIVITGSRITASGFSAPTPTTVLGEAQLQANAQPNIFNTVAQLPSLLGSTGATVGTFSTSNGQQGLSSFAVRGLGTIRTLTLLDGQRVVPANVTGVPDISLFPQLLVKRVDVVTGGASSSYGSDAVGGVVNFVTDTRFKGFKANVQGGITNYSDDKSVLAQFAYGTSFLDDRLHLIVSGEYNHDGGVRAGQFGTDLAGSRDWFRATTLVNTGVLNSTNPQYLYRDFAQASNYAKYGLISAGPLQGIAFDQNGVPTNFVYGGNGTAAGVPARNAAGTVTNCFVGFCVGGDLSGGVGSGASLKSRLDRYNNFNRIGFEFAPNQEFYVTTNIAQVKTNNQPSPGQLRSGITVQCDNAFLPVSVRNQCAAAGITSFQFGTSNGQIPSPQVFTDRRQYRFVGGLKGAVDLGGKQWTYDAYYQHGLNKTKIDVESIILTRRYDRAIDGVLVNGAIVCRDATARANGCVPMNPFGNFAPSAAALNYVTPANGPFQRSRQTQDVASANFSGEAFDLWAGPLSVAFGGEYRREFYRVKADPYGNGVNAISPNSAAYPADPVLLTDGNNYAAGNYKNGGGKYNVVEGFVELNLPLIDSEALGKANLNGAARVTRYSTSGTIWAWKAGGTWATPLDGVRLRAVTSRDIRAPNLSELFAAPTTTTLPSFTDPFRNIAVLALQNSTGNPNLVPETSRDTELGVVLARPSWLPGLSVSFDYYDVKVKNVVSSLSAQQIVNLCYDFRTNGRGTDATCGAFNLQNTAGPNFINVQSFNLASIKTDGFNIEASYQWQRPLGLDGSFTVRALGTHVRKFVTDTGVPGTIPVDTAGNNSGAIPHWKWLAIQSYSNDRFSLNVQERWFTSGVFGNQYVVCGAGSCPASTNNNPTIDRNRMKGSFYVDVGGSYNVTKQISTFFKVDNVFNRDPEASPQTNTGLDVNPALYDTLGRIYRAGVRLNF